MRYLALFGCAVLAFGGTDTKKKPEDYEVHAQARNAAVGAEYMVHSFIRGEDSFIAKDYLVVEVAIFPKPDTTVDVWNAAFTLRLNGKTQLKAVPPQLVAEGMRHPEWEDKPQRIQIGGSMGGIGGVYGGQPRQQPIPGSNPPGSEPPNRVPVPRDNPGGVEKHTVTPDGLLLETCFPEGPHTGAVSGYLYFPYKGKAPSIKTIELMYEDAVLKLK